MTAELCEPALERRIDVADFTVIKQRQQQVWATGDYATVGNTLVLVSELLCEAVDVRAGQRVLDVATGSGNTALAAARRGCGVTGLDYVPALLQRGEARATAEGLAVTFQEGDAEQLPYADGAFDVVLSTFGAMFAPDQEQTARELLRVCRPGGKVGMANWTPESFLATYARTVSQYVPPPPDLKSPMLWGTESRLRELFRDGISALEVTRRHFMFRYRSPEHWLEVFRATFGPAMAAFRALDASRQARLRDDLLAVVERMNRSGDATMAVPSEYLEVVATRR
jgi:SAM-dependent methyltransferase